jgi:TruD family tRNA pseudouridine synthase
MGESHFDHQLFLDEQKFLKEEQSRNPELFIVPKRPPQEFLERIGITGIPQDLPKGYLRFSPLDFIVEEIRPDGKLAAIEGEKNPPLLEGKGTIYADLIKVGLFTLDACERIADALSIEIKNIGYAGIKDAIALTSQTISIRGASLQEIQALSVSQIILEHLVEGKGSIRIGDLQGNRFTLTIRTERELDSHSFENILSRIEHKGIPNFYGPQRFGSYRPLAHIFGMYLCAGNYEQATHSFFTEVNPYETPYIVRIRNQALEAWGNWPKISKLMEKLPYTFRFERAMLKTLEQERGKDVFIRAIASIPLQTKLWALGYASFLTNLTLSESQTKKSPLPEHIPLVLSRDKASHKFYEKLLRRHGTENFLHALHPFPFIYISEAPTIPSRLYPKINGYELLPEGAVLSFDLIKAAYATTVLMYLFETVTELPVPEWVSKKFIDSKEVLRAGSVSVIAKKLKLFIDSLMENKIQIKE